MEHSPRKYSIAVKQEMELLVIVEAINREYQENYSISDLIGEVLDNFVVDVLRNGFEEKFHSSVYLNNETPL